MGNTITRSMDMCANIDNNSDTEKTTEEISFTGGITDWNRRSATCIPPRLHNFCNPRLRIAIHLVAPTKPDLQEQIKHTSGYDLMNEAFWEVGGMRVQNYRRDALQALDHLMGGWCANYPTFYPKPLGGEKWVFEMPMPFNWDFTPFDTTNVLYHEVRLSIKLMAIEDIFSDAEMINHYYQGRMHLEASLVVDIYGGYRSWDKTWLLQKWRPRLHFVTGQKPQASGTSESGSSGSGTSGSGASGSGASGSGTSRSVTNESGGSALNRGFLMPWKSYWPIMESYRLPFSDFVAGKPVPRELLCLKFSIGCYPNGPEVLDSLVIKISPKSSNTGFPQNATVPTLIRRMRFCHIDDGTPCDSGNGDCIIDAKANYYNTFLPARYFESSGQNSDPNVYIFTQRRGRNIVPHLQTPAGYVYRRGHYGPRPNHLHIEFREDSINRCRRKGYTEFTMSVWAFAYTYAQVECGMMGVMQSNLWMEPS